MEPRSSAKLVAALAAWAAVLPALGIAAESFDRYSYANAAGTRTYKVYVPSSYSPATPLPLVVDLHGCASDADEEARWSRFNALAAARGFLVAYPEQDPNANGGRCWNWFHPDHQSRDLGEPSLIAGITRKVMTDWSVDPRRVYVAGVSAGAGMSVIMAVTYPDLFAAVKVYAGCEYKGTTCFAGVAVLPSEVSGRLAYQAMGEHRRVVPVIVIQGDVDPLVPFPNAELIVQQFLASDDLADDGEDDTVLPVRPSSTRSGQEPAGHTYDIDDYVDASGCLLAERWLIHGMGHQWSKGESTGSPRDLLLTDPLGPDVTTPIVDFFLSHRMPEQSVECE